MAGSLGNPDSLNRYLYASDDPVNRVDPSGLLNVSNQLLKACIEWAVGAVLTVIFGAIVAAALSLPFLPVTLASLIVAAIGGCLAGVVVTVVTDILDILLPS